MEQDRSPTAWIEVPASWGDSARRFVFDHPRECWEAKAIRDVRPALDRVEAAQRDGLYVVGFLTYEASPAFDSAMSTPPAGNLPFAWFASFEAPLGSVPSVSAEGSSPPSSPETLISKASYISAVNRALAHIRDGDIYQVNYTVRAGVPVSDSLALFRTLRAAVPMPHAAYIDTGSDQIVSLSPELFLRRRGPVLETRPMKGTARREPSWAADEAARIALSRDEKNRAENVMIVDLMRNDLGRICQMGSVTVPELWRADRFPTVHQMTSLVRGKLREGLSLFDIFAALFPPGSVTGAPKIRAMQIIADLEPEPRGIYCGTIGIFFPDGDFECNVAIRTLQGTKHEGEEIKEERGASSSLLFILGLGSGIVADSDPEAEWNETLLKGRFVSEHPRDFDLFETIRYDQRAGNTELLPSFSFLDFHSHLRRLRQSCMYFGRPFPLKEIIDQLRALKKTLGDAPARIRLDLCTSSSSIKTQVIRENLSWPAGGMTVMISDLRLNPTDFRLYHKATLRPEKYEELERARSLGATEVLFLNTNGELCEGALSNIMLNINQKWLTPAMQSGLLPGTWREKQIAKGRAHEAVLTLADLRTATSIVVGNAVRGEGNVVRVIQSDGSVFR